MENYVELWDWSLEWGEIVFSMRYDLNISPIKKKVQEIGYRALYEISTRSKVEPERPKKELMIKT